MLCHGPEFLYYGIGFVVLHYVVISAVLKVVRNIYRRKIAPALGLGADFRQAGQWAVVTGCTDGIGRQYAEQLAQKKLNLILISRTQSKLDQQAEEIEKKYNVKTKTLAIDFTSESEIYDKIKEELGDYDVGTLVNNVGMFIDGDYYINIPEQKLKDCVNVNIMSMVMMTRIFLPKMADQHRGIVINISSIGGACPSPFNVVYGCSKVFVDYFTHALKMEYSKKGIIFQCVLPGPVNTKMLDQILNEEMKTTGPFGSMLASTEEYVHEALKGVGVTSRTSAVCSHSAMRAVLHFCYEVLPSCLFERIQWKFAVEHVLEGKTKKN